MAQMAKNLPTMQETQAQSLNWEDFLEKGWQLTAVFILAWRVHEQRILVGYSPWGCKESNTTISSILNPICLVCSYNLPK